MTVAADLMDKPEALLMQFVTALLRERGEASFSGSGVVLEPDGWMAAWVRQGEARAEALAPFLFGKSVAETFAELAAFDDATLRGGMENMKEAIKEGEADNTGARPIRALVDRQRWRRLCARSSSLPPLQRSLTVFSAAYAAVRPLPSSLSRRLQTPPGWSSAFDSSRPRSHASPRRRRRRRRLRLGRR